MKFIGVLLLVVVGNAMSYGVTLPQVIWLLVGIGLVFFDVVQYLIKKEIHWRYKRRY